MQPCMPANAQPRPGPVKAIEQTSPSPACEGPELSQPSRWLPFNVGGSKPAGSRLPKTLASLFFSSSSAFHAHASRRTARRPTRRRPEQATVGDGDATAASLAGARAQPKLHAAPSSGTAHSLALPRQVAPTSEIRRGAPPPASLPPRSVAVGSSGCSGFSGVGVVGDADLSSSLVRTDACSCIQHSSSPALASRIRGPGTHLQDPRCLRGGRRSSTLQSALGSRCQCRYACVRLHFRLRSSAILV